MSGTLEYDFLKLPGGLLPSGVWGGASSGIKKTPSALFFQRRLENVDKELFQPHSQAKSRNQKLAADLTREAKSATAHWALLHVQAHKCTTSANFFTSPEHYDTASPSKIASAVFN